MRELRIGCIEFAMRSPQLQSAIEQVYVEFRAPKPRTIEGCPCCTDPKEVCKLPGKPIRDLAAEELSNYGASLFLTMGDQQDFKYFLPRLLDISTTKDWWPSLEVLLGKLKLARWDEWSNRRRNAVMQVIDLWYADCLEADRLDGADIDQLLCGIGRAELSLRPYLDTLEKRPEGLEAFFDVNSHAFFKNGRLASQFWSDCPSAASEVLEFLNTPNVREKLRLN